MKNKALIDNIEKYGMNGKTKDNLIKYLEGAKLSVTQAVKCKCYDCNGYQADGRIDCKVTHCPLYPWMPYGTVKKNRVKIEISAEKKKAIVECFKKARISATAPTKRSTTTLK